LIPEAADVAEVDLDTAADLESAVQRLTHDDHLAVGTLGAEHLRVAVVAAVHTCTAHPPACLTAHPVPTLPENYLRGYLPPGLAWAYELGLWLWLEALG